MKLIVGLLLLLPALAAPLPLNHDEVFIRWAKFRYNLRSDAEALMRAQRRLENGRKGSEFGINPIRPTAYEHRGDPQAYADITAPAGSEQYGRWARRQFAEMPRRQFAEMQRYLLSNPQRRADYLIWYSKRYLAGGRVAKTKTERERANWEYFRLLQKLFKDERAKMKTRQYNPLCD